MTKTSFAHDLCVGCAINGQMITATQYLKPETHIIGTTGDLTQPVLRITLADGNTTDFGPMDMVEFTPVQRAA